MERGENHFKDEQLEVLAALYGEDVSTYKDMQDVDYLLNKSAIKRITQEQFTYLD